MPRILHELIMPDEIVSKRRIMRDFSVEEISAVDSPAQSHALTTLRKSAAPQETDMNDMDKMHNKIFARARELGKTTHTKASFDERCTIARQEMPEMAKTENRIVTAVRDDAPVRVAKSASVVAFEKRVAEVRSTEKCSYIKAMELARIRYADEFAAYQAG